MGLDIPYIRDLEDQIRRNRQAYVDGIITDDERQAVEFKLKNELRLAYGFPEIPPP